MGKLKTALKILVWLVLVFTILHIFACMGDLEMKVAALQQNVSILEENITELKHTLNQTLHENTQLKQELQEKEETINHLNDAVEYLRGEVIQYQKYGTVRTTIPYEEAWRFVKIDDTDLHEYRDPEYTCVDFANDLVRDAMQHRIFMCVTYLGFNDGTAHAVVEVNTTKGIYVIEPQTDDMFPASELHVGENYCDLVDWDCDREITKISSCFEKEVME